MQAFIKILQGPYAFLLIFQILVVSGLLFSLLWLLVKRTQEASLRENLAIVPVPEVASAPPPELGALQAKLAQLEQENIQLKSLVAESQDMKDKVKYLESKLLEYEILQEEIGTLTALKLENEHLKQSLQQFQQTESRPEPVVSPLPSLRVAPVPVMEPAAPKSPMIVMTAPEPHLAAAFVNSESAGSVDDPTAGLEGLLQQIDQLTGPGTK